MHEAHLAEDLLEAAIAEAGKRGAERIVSVRFKVGKKYRVVPEALEMGFRLAAEGTIAGSALLEVVEVPLVGRCRGCGAAVEAEEMPLVCESCGSPDVEILQGDEMILESLEVESN